MDSNTHSIRPPDGSGRLGSLAVAVAELEAEDLDRLSDTALAEELLALERLVSCLAGQWLRRLATVDGRGAAGADQGEPAPSTAAWLRNRLRMSSGAARSAVRTARAVFGGALPETAAALVAGDISPAHARVVADGTQGLAEHVQLAADPLLAETAGRLDPPGLRQAVAQLCQVADPDGTDHRNERRHDRRGLWVSPTWEGMVAVDGLLEPEAGSVVLAALEPLARPADAQDCRSGGQRTADALTELARRALEGGQLPKAGGVRPQLLVTVDLDTLLGRPGSLGGETGWAGPLDPEACRRLACDGTVTRVLVTRHPDPDPDPDPGPGPGPDPGFGAGLDPGHGDEPVGLQEHLRAAMAVLPPGLGGARRQPLEVGRATRVVQPAQRSALAVRDAGCVFPGCDRPLAWCDAHHLRHWLHGGPTDLANLALLCRAHHRAGHEGGWQLTRGPDGEFTATPPHRRHRVA